MHADKVCTAGAKSASVGHVPCFLSAFICVHLRLNISLHPSGMACRGLDSFAFQCLRLRGFPGVCKVTAA